MTWSMDWAGLVPAAAAGVQIAAVVVQVYWDRRQRSVSTAPHREGDACPACADASVTRAPGITVQVGVATPAPGPSSVIVRVSESGKLLPRVKEHGRW
ncbi:hypothetical protein ACIGO8_33330 [Streptomyces sp. NPDC053493]|uniref:hypothetical protein n=1 Tax=Streptomyces sp. NPDC053493 TaxID=3365705 RepID=UPI0037D6F0D7